MPKHIKITEKINIESEWSFILTDAKTGKLIDKKTVFNAMTDAGLAEIMRVGAMGLSSVYTVLFDGSGEYYRKAKTTRTQSGATVKYRTVFASGEGNNASYIGASLYFGATSTAASGTQVNLATQAFSKTINQILTVEVKITLS